jgi:hypothetical protein
MPTRNQMNDAYQTLKARGFEHIGSLMVDDARKDGVVDFGMQFKAVDGRMFWLNFKTIGNLPKAV